MIVRLELFIIFGLLFFLIGLFIWNVYCDGVDKTKFDKLLDKKTRHVDLRKKE